MPRPAHAPAPALGPDAFARPATAVAPWLIGATISAGAVRGRIVETEAYQGMDDLACHASKGRTPRTEVLFGPPGTLYIYLCYGMHVMLNLVCDREGEPAAVLLRAVDITGGEAFARKRRGGDSPRESLANGPAKLTQALGVGLAHNRAMLGDARCPIQIHAAHDPPARLSCGPRVGVDYAGACARWPWRWWLPGYPVAERARGRLVPAPAY